MFLHRKEDEKAKYRIVRTESGQELKITDYHLIYASNVCGLTARLKLIHARNLRVGQCVQVMDSGDFFLHQSMIVHISEVWKKNEEYFFRFQNRYYQSINQQKY